MAMSLAMKVLASLLLLVTGAGAALVATFVSQVLALRRKLDGEPLRDRGLATVDLLPWGTKVQPGVVINKDGSYLAAFEYVPPDQGSKSDEEADEVHTRVQRAFTKLGLSQRGWMVHISLARGPEPFYLPPEDCHFADPITTAIDEERRELFETRGTTFTNRFILWLTYLPSEADHLFNDLVSGRGELNPASSAMRPMLTRFEATLSDMFDAVGQLLRLSRLSDRPAPYDGQVYDDLLSWLNFVATGRKHPILVPAGKQVHVDEYVGGKDLVPGTQPKIGANHIRVVAVDGYPSDSHSGALSRMNHVPETYVWTTRYIFEEKQRAIKHLEHIRGEWRQTERTATEQLKKDFRNVDGHAVDMAASAQAALNNARTPDTATGYYNTNFVVMHEDAAEADRVAKELANHVEGHGFGARIETYNAVAAYLGSLPGCAQNKREFPFTTEHLATLMPLSTMWMGFRHVPSRMYPRNSPALFQATTHGGTPFWGNLYNTPDNGHTVVIGMTRGGKTVLLNFIAASARRYDGAGVWVFDVGRGFYTLCQAIHATTGGSSGFHWDLGDESWTTCPLADLETEESRSWAADWIDSTVQLARGGPTTVEERKAIAQAILQMASARSPNRSLSTFVQNVQHEGVRAELELYTRRGVYGKMFDAAQETIRHSDFNVFEIGELIRPGRPTRVKVPMLQYLFRSIRKQLVERAARKQPSFIIIDEGWLALSEPAFRDQFLEDLRTTAKLNCAVVLATHSAKDLVRSGAADVVLDNAPTRIFLPNPAAASRDAYEIYTDVFGLSDAQVETLRTSVRQQHYLIATPEGSRLVELELGQLARTFLTATDAESALHVQGLVEEHGDAWVDVYLSSKGLPRVEALGRRRAA